MRWILLLQEFDVIIRDKKGAENLAAYHLSRLENPHQDKLEKKEIMETFPLETLGSVALRVDSTSWFEDFANYHARNFIDQDCPNSEALMLAVLSFDHKSFTSSASFWESDIQILSTNVYL
ncbi:hypothetical protein Tco_0878903 [Tanacetum coccineum]|uniref:Reverse transcriptase domain-containing protein n=1 Tax=Tanacetum coccineum TaxID=301880 RepID=A0ABQ5C1H7_9ASTR